MTMTREQQQIFVDAVTEGLARNSWEAYERGCAVLRDQLQALKAAAHATAAEEARKQLNLF